jgi:hypothetical protein
MDIQSTVRNMFFFKLLQCLSNHLPKDVLSFHRQKSSLALKKPAPSALLQNRLVLEPVRSENLKISKHHLLGSAFEIFIHCAQI